MTASGRRLPIEASAPSARLQPRRRPYRQRLGRAAEEVAADCYQLDGYTIVGMNVRFGHLEVDVLARKGPVLVLVEVRTRGPGSFTTAFSSVTGPKLRRLRAASLRAWAKFCHDPSLERVRVDVAAVDLRRSPVTVEVARAVV